MHATIAADKTSYLSMFKQAGSDWLQDKSVKLAAALAFYTMLSIAPLLIISIRIVGKMFGNERAREHIQAYVVDNVGQKGWEAIQPMLENASNGGGGLATAVSIAILIFSASYVFGELQDSLNVIWEVKPRPDRGIWGTIKDRFFSFTLVLGVIFLLLVSLIVTTVLNAITDRLGMGEGIFYRALSFIVSFAIITGLFAAIFKYLPDVKISWRNVLPGAALTAVLFTIGKFLLGWYLGRQSTTSVYGAAGSLVALLLWVYYAAQILFFGAEFTQAYARAHGNGLAPEANAVKVTEEERAQRGMASPERVASKMAQADAPPPVRRPVVVPVATNAGGNGKRQYVLAGAGLVVGAVAGAMGAMNLKKDPTRVTRKHIAAVRLNERLAAVESKLGRVSRIRDYLDNVRVVDRIDAVEKKIRAATTTARAKATGRPKWVVRLQDLFTRG